MPRGVYERRLTPAAERFEAKVEYDPNSGCWLWTAALNNRGYGQFSKDGRAVQAHRFSAEAFNGAIPEGLDVLHRCDTPACVNPAHLFLGSHRENMADMHAKGRHTQACGDQTRSSRLTTAQVLEIKRALRRGEKQRDLADRYGVLSSTICRINTGQQWAHLTEKA